MEHLFEETLYEYVSIIIILLCILGDHMCKKRGEEGCCCHRHHQIKLDAGMTQTLLMLLPSAVMHFDIPRNSFPRHVLVDIKKRLYTFYAIRLYFCTIFGWDTDFFLANSALKASL